MLIIPHRKHTNEPPRPVTGLPLLFNQVYFPYSITFFVLFLKCARPCVCTVCMYQTGLWPHWHRPEVAEDKASGCRVPHSERRILRWLCRTGSPQHNAGYHAPIGIRLFVYDCRDCLQTRQPGITLLLFVFCSRSFSFCIQILSGTLAQHRASSRLVSLIRTFWCYVRFEVFTAVTTKNVFCDVKPQFVPHMRHITSPLQSPAS
jgi:hypothetical protein